MTNITAMTALQQTRQHFKHLGLPLPSKLATDFEKAEDVSLNFAPASAWDVTEAALAAQAEGRDPATDEAVRTALARMQYTEQAYAFAAAQQGIRDKRRTAALVKHAAALIETMRPVVEAADADIAKAREVIGTDRLHLAEPATISSLSDSQLAPWATAREARSRMERVEQVWSLLAAATNLARVEPETRALIVTDTEDLDSLASVAGYLGERVTNAASAVDAGLPLSLATFEQFTDRCARAAEHREAVEQGRRHQRDMRFPSAGR